MLLSTARNAAQSRAFHRAESLFCVPTVQATGRFDGCPVCGAHYPVAPERSRCRSARIVEHDWRCDACHHVWTTSAAVNAPPIAPGQNHRFAVGALVTLTGRYRFGIAGSPVFQVRALRSQESGDVHYRIKSDSEAFERIASESELAAVVAGH